MKKNKYALSLLLFVLLFLVTYSWIFKNYDMNLLIESLKLCDMKYILLAIFSILMFPLFEAIFLISISKDMNIKMSFYKALGYVFTEIYFSGITPSSMGGQPIQMYEMKKDGIDYYKSSIIVLLNTIIYKFTLIFLLILSLIFFGRLIFNFSMFFNVLIILGFLLNLVIIIFFISLVYSKKTINFIKKIVYLFINKLFFIKNKNAKKEKFDEMINKYNILSDFTRNRPFIFVKSFIILLLQRMSFLLVSYFIYKSFGLSDYNIFIIIAFQVCVVASVDFLPIPGGVMATEGIILSVNGLLYKKDYVLSSMLLQRSISFYLLVLLSFVFYLIFCYNKRGRKGEKVYEKEYS